MPDLEFYDQGITFTVTIRRETAVRIQVPTGTFRRIGSESSELLELLTNKKTVDELAAELGISPNAVRKRLTSLRSAGLVIQHGGRGRHTTYERSL